MSISDLISILENFKSEYGDLDVGVLVDDMAYDLDSEVINIVEKDDNSGKILAIDIDQFTLNEEDEEIDE